MKVIIDIPETEFNHIKNVWSKRRSSIPYTNVAFGTPIPDNATNGNMIKAMFPNAKTWEVTRDDIHCAFIEFKDICEIKSFPLSWWNAPFIQPSTPNHNEPEEHSCFKCSYLGWENVGDGMNPICEQEPYIEDTSDKDSSLHKSKPTVSDKNDCYWFDEKEK